MARYHPATAPAALALLSLVLLLTPTGSLPSPRWRRWAVVTAATPATLALVVPLAPGRFDPQLLVRFRSARGIERQQLRWVAPGAALMLLAAPVVLIAVALGIPMLGGRGPGDGAAGGPGCGDPALPAV